ncbi:histone-lysine N-methyltransferase ASHR2 [Humulus lupulus]|uniref:histone-lysine N-methyltransferase ASHR2 n=1 Tax=Humulus lupulus TaxID=3486 RepID=UPI002B4027A1|nr:histone-lysine N-methyltransferase ASHR2 [Humulus lupulus]
MGEREEALRAVEIPGRGRALVASQPLRGGQIVLKDSPILVYSALPLILASPSSSSYCAHCFRTLPLPLPSAPQPLPTCPNCCSERFCNHNCLSAASTSTHSPWLCQSLLRLRHHSSSLSPEQQLQARFLLAAHNLANLSSPHFQILLSLQGQSEPDSTAAAQFIYSLISSVCLPPASGWFSLELSAALLAKDKLNAFGLMEPFSESAPRSVRAYGIYPKASLFNHDCLPNACRFDYVDFPSGENNNIDIIVRMIHDVPQGREVCLSYFPVNENYPSRQKRLREDYGFACDCDRCKVEAQWSDHEGEEEQDHGEEEEEEEELMDEDIDQTMGSSAEPEGESEFDFPHAYFFVRYMCDRNNCWGTLAPPPPSAANSKSNVMECNVCGNLKNDDQQLSMDDA